MDNNIKVTVAIPVYNVEKYVEKSLYSALDQNFSYAYEVLIIDDCGNDRSMEIVQRIISSHPKGNITRVIKHEHNKGLGPARNTAIENANGEFLFFLDSDDWISVDCLSVLFQRAIETGSDVTVGSIVRIEENTGRLLGKNIYPDKTIDCPAAGVYMVNHSPDMHIEVWNKLYRLDFLKQHQIRCVHRIFEDYNFDFIMRATSNKISLCSNVTLYYNIRQNSILTSLKSGCSNEALNTLCDIINKLKELIKERFYDVDGIFDLYFQRVIWVFENFHRYHLTDKQLEYVNKAIMGYCVIINDKNRLKHPRNRYLYSRCLPKQDLQTFFMYNDKTLKHPLKFILSIIKHIKIN